MSETIEEGGKGISVYPVDQGIAMEVTDGETKSVVILGPEEAGRMAVSLLSTSILFQMNYMMLKAAEQREFDRIRQDIESGATTAIPNLANLKK